MKIKSWISNDDCYFPFQKSRLAEWILSSKIDPLPSWVELMQQKQSKLFISFGRKIFCRFFLCKAKLKLVFPNKEKMKEVLKSFLILLLLQSTYNKVNGLGTNWKKESSLLLPIDYYHYYDDDYLQFEPSHSLPVVSNNNYTKVSIQHTFVT